MLTKTTLLRTAPLVRAEMGKSGEQLDQLVDLVAEDGSANLGRVLRAIYPGEQRQRALAKGGFKFKEVDPPESPAKARPIGAAMGDDSGRIIGTKSTMTDFAGMLVIFLKRPVVDRTGLKGYYDFDVNWSALETPDRPPRSTGFGAEGIALLMPVLEHQFGLQLTKATGPVKYWVVDHVERPTSN